MTHDELLYQVRLKRDLRLHNGIDYVAWEALRAVLELHKPARLDVGCAHCKLTNTDPRPYPCPTIQAIEAELK